MTVDEIYANIGKGIFNAIDNNKWTEARLLIQVVGTGVVGYTGDYKVGETTHDLSVSKIPREIRNWIRQLHAITTEKGTNKWNRSVFMLTPDGKFSMEFIWDQALYDEIEKQSKL